MSRLRTWAENSILVFFAVFFTIETLRSAFGFNINAPRTFLTLAIASLALTGLAALWRAKGLAGATLPIILFVILKWPEITAGAKWMLFFITDEYGKWLPIPVLFSGSETEPDELTLFFIAFGLVLSLLVAAAICLMRSAFLTAIVTLPPVIPSLMLVEYVPRNVYPVGLFAVYLCLAFIKALRQNDLSKPGKAAFPAFALTMLLLFMAYLAAPPGDFSRDTRIVSYDMWLRQQFPGTSLVMTGVGWPTVSGDWRFNTYDVAVAGAGRRMITDQVLLEVTSTHAGTFYLRGYSMMRFDGRSWFDNAENTGPEDIFQAAPQQTIIIKAYNEQNPDKAIELAGMTIENISDRSNIAYYPYFIETSNVYTENPPEEHVEIISATHVDLRYNITPRDKYYDVLHNEVDFYNLRDNILELYKTLPPDSFERFESAYYNDRASDMYKQVDKSTARELRSIAEGVGISADMSRSKIAESVARYISGAANYTLSAPVTPIGEDFVLYFLKISRRGYCIHFATAATLMLRSLGVPARLTSGFVAVIPESSVGQAVEITDRSAHAWVEVYYDDVGWLPLEVTPPSSDAGIPYQSYGAATTGQYEPRPPNTPIPPRPSGGAGAGKQTPATPTDVILQYVPLGTLLLVAALILRRFVLVKVRARSFSQVNTNAAVICAWRYISRLSLDAVSPLNIIARPSVARSQKSGVRSQNKALDTTDANGFGEKVCQKNKLIEDNHMTRLKGIFGSFSVTQRKKYPEFCHPGEELCENIPQEIEYLALKARFSLHRITGEERGAVISYAENLAKERYDESGLLRRIWLRYIWGLM